jgi:hypothetical protein
MGGNGVPDYPDHMKGILKQILDDFSVSVPAAPLASVAPVEATVIALAEIPTATPDASAATPSEAVAAAPAENPVADLAESSIAPVETLLTEPEPPPIK